MAFFSYRKLMMLYNLLYTAKSLLNGRLLGKSCFRLLVTILFSSFVIIFQGGGVYAISQSAIDAINNKHPFYLPGSENCGPSNSSQQSEGGDGGGGGGNIIALDPGHSSFNNDGSRDSATGLYDTDSTGGPGEMKNVWDAANKIKDNLTKKGYKVVMTKNSENESLSLSQRADRANKSGAVLLFTIHQDLNDRWMAYPDISSKRSPGGTNANPDPSARVDKKVGLVHPDITDPSKKFAETMQPIIASKIPGYALTSFAQFYDPRGGLPGNGKNFGNTPVQTILSSIPEVYSEVHPDDLTSGKFAEAATEAIEKAVPLDGSQSNSAESGGQCCSSGGGASDDSGGVPNVADGAVSAIAHSSITATWGISESAIESYYLKNGDPIQISIIGVTESNIHSVTEAIKAEGVSPVLIYLYALNEGHNSNGTNTGFINNTTRSGSAVDIAKADARYIRDQSNIMTSIPSWYDAGNRVDFVPQDVQDAGNTDFKNMPAEVIGRAYIPATAAATWEVYYPNGLKKEYNRVQDYGSPLKMMAENIAKLGGDPMQGGASNSSGGCSGGGVTGEGIQKAISWAEMIANGNAYGYDQDTRTTGWAKYQSDPNCTDQCGNFDCSSFIAAALTAAGYFETNPNFWTGNSPEDSPEISSLKQAGFTLLSDNGTSSDNLQPGDILISHSHTAMYVGDNKMVEAVHDENHQYHGGKPGDQTGDEIAVNTFRNDGWDLGVWRATR